jgi:hypothetical protein
MSSKTPSGHCSGTNICSKRTPCRSAHLRLASTRGVRAASIATTASQREASERVKTPIEHPTSSADRYRGFGIAFRVSAYLPCS